jgi:hypothetical protein
MNNEKPTLSERSRRDEIDDMQRREQQQLQKKAEESEPTFEIEELNHDKHS